MKRGIGASMAIVFLVFSSGCNLNKRSAIRVKITARKYSYEPPVIHVKQGEQVELEISTTDVQHGFEAKGLGIDESIQKGKPAIVTFKAERRGEYSVNCDIICGPGHDGMEGKIVVD